MATIYGNTTNHWRCYIDTWSSSDSSSVSAGLTVGIQDCGWGFQISSGIVGHANAGGTQSEVNTGFNTATGSWSTKNITSASKKFAKKKTAYNVTLSGWVRNQSGYMNGTSSASQTITIPALAHHYISFDANGGTGAPSKVDKWYGEDLTIPSVKPTRENYEFLGWSKTKNGTAQYRPGKTYNGTPDADYTLYAVWKLVYVPPKFVDGLAIRTNSITSTTPDYLGGYCYASFSYEVDTTIYPDNIVSSVTCQYYTNESTTGTSITPTGTLNQANGTVNVHFQASINSNYAVECVITDTKNGTSKIIRSIGTGIIPMEVANGGKSVGILSAAPTTGGFKVGGFGTPEFSIAADTISGSNEYIAKIGGTTSSDMSTLTLDAEQISINGKSYSMDNLVKAISRTPKMLWSGTVKVHNSITMPVDVNNYLVFAAKIQDWSCWMLGIKNPTNPNGKIAFSGGYDQGRYHEYYLFTFETSSNGTVWKAQGGNTNSSQQSSALEIYLTQIWGIA